MCWKVPHELRSHALLGSGPRARHRRPLGRTAVAARAERRAEPHCTPAGGEREVRRKVPACAGPTRSRSRQASTFAEDPRVRGADATGSSFSRSRLGGSPRARGRRRGNARGVLVARRIPACAGPTPWRARRRSLRPEDPRVRGADQCVQCLPCLTNGGSPRARGQQGPAVRARPSQGRIPACAGSTRCRSPSWSSGPEDPRVRGVNTRPAASIRARIGGSPRVRGRRYTGGQR